MRLKSFRLLYSEYIRYIYIQREIFIIRSRGGGRGEKYAPKCKERERGRDRRQMKGTNYGIFCSRGVNRSYIKTPFLQTTLTRCSMRNFTASTVTTKRMDQLRFPCAVYIEKKGGNMYTRAEYTRGAAIWNSSFPGYFASPPNRGTILLYVARIEMKFSLPPAACQNARNC